MEVTIAIKDLWWVFLVSAIVLLGLVIFYRVQYVLLKKDIIKRRSVAKLRFKVAQDLSDDLSNGFNNIRIIAKESDTNNIEEFKITINSIRNLCNENIELMEDIIWATKFIDCTVEDLLFKFEDHVDDVLRSKDIPVEFINDGLVMTKKLNFFQRRNFLLIFKEGIKHIDPTITSKVEVNLIYQSGHFEMWIKNYYSKKIDTKMASKSKYTRMQELCERIGGKLEIRESSDRFEVGLIQSQNKDE